MSSAFAGRRRADRFDALLGDPTATADDARTAELLAVVGALRSVPAPAPRADFSASLRERLMAEADTVLLPRDRSVDARLTLPASARPARTRRDRRLAVAAGTLAVVGATTSMAMAAQTALPGDALYPVKRALEEARTEVSVGDGAKGSTLLTHASGRLDELAELARLDTPESAAAVPGTLEAFTEQAQEASDLIVEDYQETGEAEAIAALRDFTAQSMAELAALTEVLPVSAQASLEAAAAVLAAIDAEAAALCPTCGGSGITEVPLSLLGAAGGRFTDLMAPARATDSADRPGRAVVGARGPGRPVRPAPAQPAQPQVPTEEVTSPGSVFSPPSGGGGGGTRGGDPTLGGLLPGGSTGASGGGLGSVTEPLEPLLEPLKPVTDPVTGLVDDALEGLGDGLGDLGDGLAGGKRG